MAVGPRSVRPPRQGRLWARADPHAALPAQARLVRPGRRVRVHRWTPPGPLRAVQQRCLVRRARHPSRRSEEPPSVLQGAKPRSSLSRRPPLQPLIAPALRPVRGGASARSGQRRQRCRRVPGGRAAIGDGAGPDVPRPRRRRASSRPDPLPTACRRGAGGRPHALELSPPLRARLRSLARCAQNPERS